MTILSGHSLCCEVALKLILWGQRAWAFYFVCSGCLPRVSCRECNARNVVRGSGRFSVRWKVHLNVLLHVSTPCGRQISLLFKFFCNKSSKNCHHVSVTGVAVQFSMLLHSVKSLKASVYIDRTAVLGGGFMHNSWEEPHPKNEMREKNNRWTIFTLLQMLRIYDER